MKVGLIDVDGHNFPNLALMKISAWHKKRGDEVEWWFGFSHYDIVYMSKVFDETYSEDIPEPFNAEKIIKGGTGYVIRKEDNSLNVYHDYRWSRTESLKNIGDDVVSYTEYLPYEVEHIYPDYSIYPELTKNTAFGFLTRGCPRGCHFCIVAGKEGRASRKVADLSEWWNGQKNIVLMDPNTLACPQHIELLKQLADSGAWVDINQGADARLLTEENIQSLNNIKLKMIHFAWDQMDQSQKVLHGLELYKKFGKLGERKRRVYVLTNFGTTMEENLYRIYKLRELSFDPYVMVYDKPNAPKEIKRLQRWVNNKYIWRSCEKFEDYK